jgi:transcriptional regulator with XRE-family HTH domain
MTSFRDQLKALRKAKRLSRREAAILTSSSISSFNHWEAPNPITPPERTQKAVLALLERLTPEEIHQRLSASE